MEEMSVETSAMKTLDSTTIIRRNPRVEYRSVGDGEGGVLLRLDNGAYHGVNDVGGLVWRLIDDISFGTLIDVLRVELVGVPETFPLEISAFLDELASRELVELVVSSAQA
jgi:hypothetical protein